MSETVEDPRDFDLKHAKEYGRELFGGAPDTIGQSYVVQAMRHQYELDKIVREQSVKQLTEVIHELKNKGDLNRADYRNMYEALVSSQQFLKNALADVEHQILRFKGRV